jgi:hypothetical protein
VFLRFEKLTVCSAPPKGGTKGRTPGGTKGGPEENFLLLLQDFTIRFSSLSTGLHCGLANKNKRTTRTMNKNKRTKQTIREIITVLEEQRSSLADIQAVLLRASHEDVMPDIIQRTETLDFKMIEKRNGRRAFK